MTQLNFNIPFLDMEDRPFAERVDETQVSIIKLSRVLGNVLGAQTVKEPVQSIYFSWIVTLGKTGILDVDDTSKNTLLNFIKENDTFNVMQRGRLLEVFNQSVVKAEGDPVPPDPTHPPHQ